nr:nucleotide-binding alpha-beta plait domain-containing protein [Tanacetum cinerariifolium]
MRSYRSKEDDVYRISTSIYVSNFPESFSAKDLFHSCKQYGHVVDTFNPFKRSKDGKRFGFVRFINVFNGERLVSNLCIILVDRSKFHANIARLHRAPLNNNKVPMEQKFGYNRNINNVHAKEGVTIGSSKSYVHAVKVKNMFGALKCDFMPSIVLDDECLIFKDLSKALLGRVKDFASLPNLKIVLKNEGFAEIKIQYMGEFWVLLEFPSSKTKELFQENMGVWSWFSVCKQASSDFIPEGKIVWVEIEGVPFKLWSKNTFNGLPLKVPGWVPEFVDDSDDDDESDNGFKDGDAKVQDGGRCRNDSDEVEVSETMFEESLVQKVNQSKDSFGIYLLLKKNKDKSKNMKPSDHSLKYPPGFTPNGDNNEFCMHEENVRSVNEANSLNCNFKKSEVSRMVGSILCVSKELVKMGQAMGYNMDRCVNNMTAIIESQGASGCDGEVVIMGDFNEVRFKSERFGSVFNVQVANVFNAFIANASLEEVPLGGSSLTWCHKSATKMSKLDRLEVLNSIQHLDKIKAMDVAQKAKVKWAIEGDENTRFDKPIDNRVHIDMNFPKSITIDQQVDLECAVSKEELKRAVWECGTDKSPGPNGLSFGFYRQFWSSIKNDVFAAVSYFFTFGDIPNGCNSCFIALIPKVPDDNLVKDFRPISLIRSMYKIIAKILANRLVGVVEHIVNEAQKWEETCLGCKLERRLSIRLHGLNGKVCWLLKRKEVSGLSLYALNRALMMKWVWRFYSQKESLWARVLKAIYGDDGQAEKVSRAGSRSCWRNIVTEVRILSNQGIKVLDYMLIKLRNGESTAFWNDNWIGGKVLKWVWSLEGSGEFSVASIRKIIDDNRLLIVDTRTLWIKHVPIKVNVLAWKIKIEALLTRFNISCKGIDIDSILCPIYVNSYVEWFNWINSLRLKSKSKLMIEGVFYFVWWHVWTFRNKLLFEDKKPSKAIIFDDVVSRSYYWCKFRCKASFSWDDWLKIPNMISL